MTDSIFAFLTRSTARAATASLIAAIHLYRAAISPHLVAGCRYVPSCSHYMEEALRTHGPVSGLRLGLGRLSRCHPFGRSGADPVPNRRA